jgi:hypothetical protein
MSRPTSSRVRVYVPSTLGRLRSVVTSDGVGPAPFVAHAVTDALRAALPDGDDEDWEYAASSAAAQSAVGLLHDDEPARRVVLAVDVPGVRAVDLDDPTVVEVDEVVPYRRIAAVLADGPEAEPDVTAARDALAAGSAEAHTLLERCLDHDLGWWATQEIGDLLGAAGVV